MTGDLVTNSLQKSPTSQYGLQRRLWEMKEEKEEKYYAESAMTLNYAKLKEVKLSEMNLNYHVGNGQKKPTMYRSPERL